MKPVVPALVFGASGEQGRAVMEGLVDLGYTPVYGFTRLHDKEEEIYLRDGLGGKVLKGDVANPEDVRKALLETKAQAIFFVTTTELPTEIGQTTGCWNAMEAEYEVIQMFFDSLVHVHKEDGIQRHVVFSTKDNVEHMYHDKQNCATPRAALQSIAPMDDGSIVPHYSAKGRGAEYAMKVLQNIEGLTLTLLTLPFVYSNFLGFFTPLPVSVGKDGNTTNQWQISASLGDGLNPIDMISVTDLSVVVPNIFEDPTRYRNKNIRLSACRISMDEIAAAFSDLFGKDVIYNPLLPDEVADLPFPSAPAMAQMCQYLQHTQYDTDMTRNVMFPTRPQKFQDWLLTHSDSQAFKAVGLDLDAPEITSVVVFGSTSPQGASVVKGLLDDARKQYTVRATTRHPDGPKAKALKELDPERVTIVYADLDAVKSCQDAADGMDGAFLVTDFYTDANRNSITEEQHAKNVIDACEASHSIRHLVFSTMDDVAELNHVMDLGLQSCSEGTVGGIHMSAKAKAAAYARTKKLSVTYVILPCYSEMFLDMIQRYPAGKGDVMDTSPTSSTGASAGSGAHKKEKLVLRVPLKDSETKVMCMSVDDLGPAVSNIFDSYQVYAGHEIGLVTDFVTVSEIRDMLNAVIMEEDGGNGSLVIESHLVSKEDWVDTKENDTYMKDLGQMFAYLSHTDVVRKRHSIARTMKLVPSAKPLRMWVEKNKDNPAFREKLGLR